MKRSGALVRAGLRRSKWLLPWIGVLLVSATFAYAMNGALSGSWATPSWWPAVSFAAMTSPAHATETVADENADLRGPCTSLFGSYNFWLFDKDRTGPCGLGAANVADPPSDR